MTGRDDVGQEAGRGSAVEEAIAASRRLHPDLWRKVDEIAEIIAPGAFATWYDSACPDPQPVEPSARVKAKRATARRKAWEILQYLGEVPEETDWMAIFKEAALETLREELDHDGGDDG